MKNPTLTFLWHMHQPYYRNMITNECIQPWARLHGIHSYYDMMKLYEEYQDISVNINFVPSLLRQLREFAEKGYRDKFLAISEIDAKELTPDQKMFILRNFFMANPDRMIKPSPRYWKLYQQRGANTSKIDFEDAIRYFSWKDYLDIQVYYNLVWFGFKAREEYPEIDKMLNLVSSGNNFTEADKAFVLKTQKEVLVKLLHSIRNAPKNIEITTTPYFHPILPLLIDTDTAKRCMPNAELPPRLTALKHAEFQVNHGIEYFEESVGHKPTGMWPAEGSVSPEIIPILSNAGVKWIATDEGILHHSGIGGKRNDYLYQPFIAEHNGKEIAIVFRDRELSDLISFSYSKMPSDQAAEHLIQRAKEIGNSAGNNNPLITILLDGENPWESYEDNGKKFLVGVMERIRKEHIKTTTVNDFITKNPPTQRIKNLFSGSWINSNYAIWIGKPQKNQAWSYIKRTMDELGHKLSAAIENPNRSEKESQALESFGAACGSDWFWWFDDDFESEFKSDFDKIFRMHLKNTFSLFGRDVPVFLYEPIHHYKEPLHHQHGPLKPAAFIYPSIDGLNTSFFEWSNAVKLDVGKHRGPMGQTEELFETIYFGFNLEGVFLRLDPFHKEEGFSLHEQEEVVVYLHNNKKYKLRLFHNGSKYHMEYVNSVEEGYVSDSHTVKWSMDKVFEMGATFKDLKYGPGDKVTVIVTVVRRGIEVRHYSHIEFEVPDETYEKEMWSV